MKDNIIVATLLLATLVISQTTEGPSDAFDRYISPVAETLECTTHFVTTEIFAHAQPVIERFVQSL